MCCRPASFLRDLFCRRLSSSSPSWCLRQSRRKRFATTASPVTTLLTTVVVVVLCSSPSSFGAFSPRTKTVSRRRCTFVASTQKNLLFCVEIFPTQSVCRDILGVHNFSHATLALHLLLLFFYLPRRLSLSLARWWEHHHRHVFFFGGGGFFFKGDANKRPSRAFSNFVFKRDTLPALTT